MSDPSQAPQTGARTRHVLIASLILGLLITPVAVGKTGDALREGQRNGTTTRETQIIGDLNQSTKSTGGYVTRQSNKSASGGGAIYGCRARDKTEPCVRANNLSNGRAFEFETDGAEGGRIETKDANGRPFTTNATQVATGLNADKVDGKDASELMAGGGNPGKSDRAQATASSSNNSTDTKGVNVNCPGGKKAFGGGAQIDGAGGNVAVTQTQPRNDNGWHAEAREIDSTNANWKLTAYVICS